MNAVQVAQGIRDTLATQTEWSVVYQLPVAQPESGSATVVPLGGDAETAGRRSLRFGVTVMATAADFGAAFAWLHAAVDRVVAALAADPKCSGTCTGTRVESWGRVYATTGGGGADMLALDITLAATYPRGGC